MFFLLGGQVEGNVARTVSPLISPNGHSAVIIKMTQMKVLAVKVTWSLALATRDLPGGFSVGCSVPMLCTRRLAGIVINLRKELLLHSAESLMCC